jgi:hypothetical protein
MKLQMSRIMLSIVVMVICGMGSAHASTVLTFYEGSTSFNGRTESGFNYRAVSGRLEDASGGDPGGNIVVSGDGVEDDTATGTLGITGSLGQTFTFEGLNYESVALNSIDQLFLSVVVTGYLDNTLVGSATYSAFTNESSPWYVGLAGNLEEKNIDTLDISLTLVDGFNQQFQIEHAWFTAIDNVELGPAFDVDPPPTSPSAVPEPSAFALLGTGLLGLASGVRRKLIRS